MLTWIDWLMIFGYFGVLAGVVVFSLRRNKIESGEDLFLGGRSVGWLAIGRLRVTEALHRRVGRRACRPPDP